MYIENGYCKYFRKLRKLILVTVEELHLVDRENKLVDINFNIIIN